MSTSHSAPPAASAAAGVARLTSLAAVELQLCLQPLDNQSRVMAARCSRGLLKAASHAFAWRHAETVIVSELATKEVAAHLKSAASLQRLAPLLYRAPAETGSDELQRVLRLDNLTGLDLSRGPTGFNATRILSPLLSHADTQQRLRRLALMFNQRCSAAFACAVSMPHLTSFAAFAYYDAALLRDFASAHTLTRLNLSLGSGKDLHLPLESFSTLRELRLSNARWIGDALATIFLSAPRLCATLQHLALAASKLEQHAAAKLGEVFPSLVSLQTLELHDVNGAASLLPVLSRGPALRSLQLQVSNGTNDALLLRRITPTAVAGMLGASPLLHLRLICPGIQVTSMAYSLDAPPVGSSFAIVHVISRLPRVSVMAAASGPMDLLQS